MSRWQVDARHVLLSDLSHFSIVRQEHHSCLIWVLLFRTIASSCWLTTIWAAALLHRAWVLCLWFPHHFLRSTTLLLLWLLLMHSCVSKELDKFLLLRLAAFSRFHRTFLQDYVLILRDHWVTVILNGLGCRILPLVKANLLHDCLGGHLFLGSDV